MHGTKSSLIFSKSRIAPIKGMTIPRLELMAILIGTRAAQFVMTQLDLTNTKQMAKTVTNNCVDP
uniref:Uncharacterized protein n=1 Tax=Loa loa TaxID=7209 RepID=A0A1I7VXE7_LOALO